MSRFAWIYHDRSKCFSDWSPNGSYTESKRIELPNLLVEKVHYVKSAVCRCVKSWPNNIAGIIHGIIPERKFFTSSSSNRAFQIFQSFESGEIISTLDFQPSLSFWLDHTIKQNVNFPFRNDFAMRIWNWGYMFSCAPGMNTYSKKRFWSNIMIDCLLVALPALV